MAFRLSGAPGGRGDRAGADHDRECGEGQHGSDPDTEIEIVVFEIFETCEKPLIEWVAVPVSESVKAVAKGLFGRRS